MSRNETAVPRVNLTLQLLRLAHEFAMLRTLALAAVKALTSDKPRLPAADVRLLRTFDEAARASATASKDAREMLAYTLCNNVPFEVAVKRRAGKMHGIRLLVASYRLVFEDYLDVAVERFTTYDAPGLYATLRDPVGVLTVDALKTVTKTSAAGIKQFEAWRTGATDVERQELANEYDAHRILNMIGKCALLRASGDVDDKLSNEAVAVAYNLRLLVENRIVDAATRLELLHEMTNLWTGER